MKPPKEGNLGEGYEDSGMTSRPPPPQGSGGKAVSKQSKDGGPAFPYPSLESISITSDGYTTHQQGMHWRPGNVSVLDLFAAAAFQGMVSSGGEWTNADRAKDAYDYAESMLAERERRMG